MERDREDSFHYIMLHINKPTQNLSDASMSALSMLSIASLKASQPSSPRQLPVESYKWYLCFLLKQLGIFLQTPAKTLPGFSQPWKLLPINTIAAGIIILIQQCSDTVQIHSLHVRFVHDSLSYHKCRCFRDLTK